MISHLEMAGRNLASRLPAQVAWWMSRGSGLVLDWLHKVDTGPGVPAGNPDKAGTDLGTPYSYDPAPWRTLSRSLRLASLEAERFTFVDIGCGKGRILLSALALPFRRIVGVEFSPVLCRIAEKNVASARFIP